MPGTVNIINKRKIVDYRPSQIENMVLEIFIILIIKTWFDLYMEQRAVKFPKGS
jgi:hypothetical protein